MEEQVKQTDHAAVQGDIERLLFLTECGVGITGLPTQWSEADKALLHRYTIPDFKVRSYRYWMWVLGAAYMAASMLHEAHVSREKELDKQAAFSTLKGRRNLNLDENS